MNKIWEWLLEEPVNVGKYLEKIDIEEEPLDF